MKCPHCGADAIVLTTRHYDNGHRTTRRLQCFNDHRFTTQEVHAAVYCSAKPRQKNYLETITERSRIARRNDQIRRRLTTGESRKALAAEYGLSKSSIHLIVRRAKDEQES